MNYFKKQMYVRLWRHLGEFFYKVWEKSETKNFLVDNGLTPGVLCLLRCTPVVLFMVHTSTTPEWLVGLLSAFPPIFWWCRQNMQLCPSFTPTYSYQILNKFLPSVLRPILCYFYKKVGSYHSNKMFRPLNTGIQKAIF